MSEHLLLLLERVKAPRAEPANIQPVTVMRS